MAFYSVKDGNLTPVAGGTLYADCPVGTILAYGGTTPPAGWFVCDGTALNRTSFAELFSVIGTQFGAGNGSTTFNIPDMREMVPRGAGTQSLKTVGAHNAKNVGEFQDDRIQNVTGKIEISGDGSWQPPVDYSGTGAIVSIGSGTVSCGGSGGTINDQRTNGFTFDASRVARTGTTTEVKSIGVNYIIKATRIAVPADFMSSIYQLASLKWYNGSTSRTVTNGTTEQTAVSINIPPSSSPRAFIMTSVVSWSTSEPLENRIFMDSNYSGGHVFTSDQSGVAGRLTTVTAVEHLDGDNAAHVISNKVKYMGDNATISSRLKVIEIRLPESA